MNERYWPCFSVNFILLYFPALGTCAGVSPSHDAFCWDFSLSLSGSLSIRLIANGIESSQTGYPRPPSLVNIAQILSRSFFRSMCSFDFSLLVLRKTSCMAAHSNAEPLAISKNFLRSASEAFPLPSAMLSGMDWLARNHWSRACR